MIYHQPVALIAALERVRVQHPVSSTQLDTGEGLQDGTLWNTLARKLDETSLNRIPVLEKSLSSRERKIVGYLINHSSEDIRLKVAALAQSNAQIIKPSVLWEYVTTNIERPESLRLANVVATYSPYQRELGPLRTALLRALDERSLVGLANEFWRVAKEFNSYETVRQELRLEEGSRLGQMVQGNLLKAMRATWLVVDVNYFDRALERTQIADVVDVLLAEYLIWSKRSKTERDRDRYFGRLLAHLDERTFVQKDLENRNRQAWLWYKELLAFDRIESIFARDGNNERFQFWWGYLDRMQGLPEVDRQNERIFLNFGSFGVVEFARVGNAAYFYTPRQFATVIRYQHDEGHRQKNDEFKRRQPPYLKKTHTRGTWQARFQQDLEVYFSRGLE